MAFIRTDNNNDLLTINGFRFEINGQPIAAITNVGGLNRTTGEIEWVDGGTGITEFFSDQKKVYGPISLKYRVDPTKGEFDLLRQFVTLTHLFGTRFDFTLVKYNHGVEVFRILVYKVLFKEEQFSEFDKNGSGPFEVTINAPCAFWEIIGL